MAENVTSSSTVTFAPVADSGIWTKDIDDAIRILGAAQVKALSHTADSEILGAFTWQILENASQHLIGNTKPHGHIPRCIYTGVGGGYQAEQFYQKALDAQKAETEDSDESAAFDAGIERGFDRAHSESEDGL